MQTTTIIYAVLFILNCVAGYTFAYISLYTWKRRSYGGKWRVVYWILWPIKAFWLHIPYWFNNKDAPTWWEWNGKMCGMEFHDQGYLKDYLAEEHYLCFMMFFGTIVKMSAFLIGFLGLTAVVLIKVFLVIILLPKILFDCLPRP